MKIVKAFPDKPEYSDMLKFYCPGCKVTHMISKGPKSYWKRNAWTFNGDYDKPTFNPSLLVTMDCKEYHARCHSFIRDGKIQFLSDCTHSLAGQTVEIQDMQTIPVEKR